MIATGVTLVRPLNLLGDQVRSPVRTFIAPAHFREKVPLVLECWIPMAYFCAIQDFERVIDMRNMVLTFKGKSIYMRRSSWRKRTAEEHALEV